MRKERNQFNLLTLSASMLVSAVYSNSFATTITTTLSPIKTDESKLQSSLSGSLEYQSNTLVDNVGEVTGNKYFTDFNLNYTNKGSNGVEKVFDARGRLNNEEQLMFSIPEAKIGYTFGQNEIVVGRHILDWSLADQTWGLGKLNNRINFDGFNPGQEGLVGFTYSRRNRTGFKASIFASVLYVPETNPGTKINKEDGTIECQNPWCKAPAPTAPISEDTEVPIYYNVNYPELTEIVFRMSGGLELGYEGQFWGVDVFGIRKPENQISTSAEIKYETKKNRVFADITPQVYYHDVVGGNLRLKPYKGLTFYGTAIGIYPSKYPDGDQPYIEYTGIKPEKRKEEYAGAGVAFESSIINTGVNYIARVSKYDKENDLLAEYPRWSQAYNAYVSTRILRKLSLGIDYKYDMLTEDRLAMYKAEFQATKSLNLAVGVNMIGSGSDQSYWSDFANNDSVYGSLKYTY